MFEVGWTEMLVIAVVMIVVVGPKDLPGMLRTFGRTVAKLRSMAGDFQKQFNEALKEAELEDVKNSVDALRGLNPTAEIKKQLNPFEKAANEVRAGLDNAMKPKPQAAPDTAPVAETKPLSGDAGATGKASDATPTFPAMTDASVVAAPAAAKAAKSSPAKATSAKSTPAKSTPAKPASKPAKAQDKPAVVASTAPAKSTSAKSPAKAAPAKRADPKPGADKKAAAAGKKTAGAAK